jgi:hypothetical protein
MSKVLGMKSSSDFINSFLMKKTPDFLKFKRRKSWTFRNFYIPGCINIYEVVKSFDSEDSLVTFPELLERVRKFKSIHRSLNLRSFAII